MSGTDSEKADVPVEARPRTVRGFWGTSWSFQGRVPIIHVSGENGDHDILHGRKKVSTRMISS